MVSIKGLLARHGITGAIGLFSLLVAANSARAQEKWQPELVINHAPAAAVPCSVTTVPTQLCFPDELSENPKTGELLVADTYHDRVLIYNADGTYKSEVVTGSFRTPYGVVADADGNIVVADTGHGTVRVFDPTGSQEVIPQIVLPQIVLPIAVPAPYRVHVAPGTHLFPPVGTQLAGLVYVVDGNNNLVLVYDVATGTWPITFGGNGTDPQRPSTQGAFSAPTGISVDSAGRIYVVDPNVGRIAIYDGKGVWLADVCNILTHGIPCTIPFEATYPFGVTVDAQDRMLVADGITNNIAVFSKYVGLPGNLGLVPLNVIIGMPTVGTNGPVPCDPLNSAIPCLPDFADGRDLQGVVNINVDAQGRLLVADSGNMRVTRFGHTLSLSVSASPSRVALRGPITVTVTAFTGSGNVTNVLPTVTASNPGLVTPATVGPTSIKYHTGSNADANVPAGGVTVAAGSPVIFTATFTAASSGAGAVQFTATATGVNDQGKPLSALAASSAAIAINPPSGSAVHTQARAASGSQLGTSLGGTAIGWLIGSTAPTIQITPKLGSGTPNKIDYQFSSTNQAGGRPNEPCSPTCVIRDGASADIVLTAADGFPGHRFLWFRGRNTVTGDTENYNVVDVAWESGSPLVDFTYSTDALWAPKVRVHWTITPGVSTMPLGVPSEGDQDVVNEGAGITWSKTGIFDAAGMQYVNPVDGSHTATTRALNIDGTGPIIDRFDIYKTGTTVAPPAPQCQGCPPSDPKWYNTALDIVFSAHDPLPLVAPAPPATRTQSGFGISQSASNPPVDGDTKGRSVMNAVSGANQTFSAGPGTFIDRAGNKATNSLDTPPIYVDAIPPLVSAAVTAGTPGIPVTSGWYTSAVTITFTASDTLSGLQKFHYDVLDAASNVVAKANLPVALALSAVVSNAGKNTVKFYAIDKAGNQSASSSINAWISLTPPTLTNMPGPIVQTTTSLNGTVVNYTAPSVTDPSDPNPTTSCSPASGTIFPLGVTTVTCTATNAAGLSAAPSSFTVSVKAIVTAAITATSKGYDRLLAAAFSCSVLGTRAGDVVTCTAVGATFADVNVGTGKPVTATGITLSGAAAANYTLNAVTTATTTANITARPITVAAVADTRAYNGTTSSAGKPVIVSGTLAGSDTAVFTQTFDTKDAGIGKTLTPAGSVTDGNGGLNYAVTFRAATGTITAAPTTTAVAATPNPLTVGQPVTLTATVAPMAASGSVRFFDGATLLGSASLLPGTASLQTTALTLGSHSITATYLPDTGNYSGSTSGAVTVVVRSGDDHENDGNEHDKDANKGDDNKAGDHEAGDNKPGDHEAGDNKPGDHKAGDNKPGDHKAGGNKPGDKNDSNTKGGGRKGSDGHREGDRG